MFPAVQTCSFELLPTHQRLLNALQSRAVRCFAPERQPLRVQADRILTPVELWRKSGSYLGVVQPNGGKVLLRTTEAHMRRSLTDFWYGPYRLSFQGDMIGGLILGTLGNDLRTRAESCRLGVYVLIPQSDTYRHRQVALLSFEEPPLQICDHFPFSLRQPTPEDVRRWTTSDGVPTNVIAVKFGS